MVTSGRGLAAVTVWRLLAVGVFIRWRRETFLLREIFRDAQRRHTAEVAAAAAAAETRVGTRSHHETGASLRRSQISESLID